MYNVNSSGLLPVPMQGDATGATPRTPEILNSLIAMTNPFDAMRHGVGPRVASSPPSDSTSTSSSSASSNSPPSVQHTCSQLIKEGLKLTIQTKRRNNPASSLADEPLNKSTNRSDEFNFKLTPEDEERRRRRRERNKIAATKCRLKKRERTVNLVQESEILENQNQDLKSQIQDLENERRRLVDMLSVHGPSCSKQPNGYNGVGSPSSGTSVSSYQECYTQCTSASSSPAGYSGYQPSYCKVEASCEAAYRHKTETSSSYQKMDTVEDMSAQGGYGRPSSGGGASSSVMLSYHNFEQQGVVSFCHRQVESEGYPRNEPAYADGYGSRGSPSRIQQHYPRPATLGLLRNPAAEYEANNNILDSPNVAPTNYHHFDEDADNFAAAAGFPSGSCVT